MVRRHFVQKAFLVCSASLLSALPVLAFNKPRQKFFLKKVWCEIPESMGPSDFTAHQQQMVDVKRFERVDKDFKNKNMLVGTHCEWDGNKITWYYLFTDKNAHALWESARPQYKPESQFQFSHSTAVVSEKNLMAEGLAHLLPGLFRLPV